MIKSTSFSSLKRFFWFSLIFFWVSTLVGTKQINVKHHFHAWKGCNVCKVDWKCQRNSTPFHITQLKIKYPLPKKKYQWNQSSLHPQLHHLPALFNQLEELRNQLPPLEKYQFSWNNLPLHLHLLQKSRARLQERATCTRARAAGQSSSG